MRLITRSDFDGLACATLLVEKGIVDQFLFVHPKDVQDGKVQAIKDDVVANLPFIEGCGLWFDHHLNEIEQLDLGSMNFEGAVEYSASAAQVIWDYFGGKATFGERFVPFIRAVNICDAGSLTLDEILTPEDWILLSFITDSRSGLGYYSDYRISNYQLMLDMIQFCAKMPIKNILAHPDVQERVNRYFNHQEPFKQMLKSSSYADGSLIVTNLMDEEKIFVGNRFMIYALYPEQNIDLRLMWGKNRENVVIACGHSVLNKTCRVNVGRLMAEYGGGGHAMVGTCQVPTEKWEETLNELVGEITLTNFPSFSVKDTAKDISNLSNTK